VSLVNPKRVMALLEVIEIALNVVKLDTRRKIVLESNQSKKRDLATNVERWVIKLVTAHLQRTLELASNVVKLAIVRKPALRKKKQSSMEKKPVLSAERKATEKETALRLTKTRLEIENVSNVVKKATEGMSALMLSQMEQAKENFRVLNVESQATAS